MAHNDYDCLHKVRYRWQKEQQLIRQKYQIPYNMTYTFKQCSSKPISITSQIESVFKHDKITVTQDELKKKTNRLDKHCFNIKNNDSNIPPMFCSKCHLNLTECLCQDGLGQWWIHLQKKSHSTDKITNKSLINSIRERHVSFDSSLIDLTSIERTKSKYTKQQYVLLDWNNHQSLLNFIQITKSNKNLSNLTIEQLRQLITDDTHIHIFNSIIDLILSINKELHRPSLCHIYIDPYYYSTIHGAIPFSQSHEIADNINLHRALYGIQKMSCLLGVKIDQTMNEFLHKKISIKQRKSILNQQSLFITSKIPDNTFHHTSVHAQ